MAQNKFSIKLRATDEGGLEFETDPPTKPPKGTTSAAVAAVATVSDPKFTIEGSFPDSSSSPSNKPPRTLICIPGIGVEFELDEGWGLMTVNIKRSDPPTKPPHK
jgi:hypothetical protein